MTGFMKKTARSIVTGIGKWALPRCSEMGREYDNPWDANGTNFNGGSYTVKFNAKRPKSI